MPSDKVSHKKPSTSAHWTRVQTAEGWKNTMKKLKNEQKVKKKKLSK